MIKYLLVPRNQRDLAIEFRANATEPEHIITSSLKRGLTLDSGDSHCVLTSCGVCESAELAVERRNSYNSLIADLSNLEPLEIVAVVHYTSSELLVEDLVLEPVLT